MTQSVVPLRIDDVVLNFSPDNVVLLNAILAIVTFSIAIDLKSSDFKQLTQTPKPLLTGLFSQFVVLPVFTYMVILLTVLMSCSCLIHFQLSAFDVKFLNSTQLQCHRPA